MSQQPQKYERNFDFNTFSQSNPTAQQPGNYLDIEFNDVKLSLDQTIDRLNEIQRDDGKVNPLAIDPSGLIPGPKGDKGDKGDQGIAGPQGIQGLIGPQGIQGLQGPQGHQGPQGVMGPQGIQGEMGPIGQAGPVGPQGIQGQQGLQGINGDKYATTSTTNASVSSGTKTFLLGGGLAYTTQQSVVVAYDANHHMHGDIIAYDASTGVAVIEIKNHTGSGTYNSWTINLEGAAGIQGPQGIQGIQGPAGVNGQAGSTGPQGIQGAAGPQGPAGNAWVYRGEYDGGITYSPNDYVSFQGASYVMTNFIGAAGYDPVGYPGSWQLVALRGETGANGSDGYNGSDGPQGEQGPQGPEGPPGPGVINWRGDWQYYSYYSQNDAVSYDGSSWIAQTGHTAYSQPYVGDGTWGLLARKGDQGPQGESGGGGGSNPYYYHSVWAYNTWYSASVTTVYDTNYNYVNVLTF